MTPLLVYLDSSDFSTFASAEPGSKASNTFHALLKLRDSGKVKIPYSYPHIAEAAPVKQDASKYARARGQCIEALCLGHVVIEPRLLLDAEVMAIDSGIPLDRGSVYSDDGRWWPAFPVEDEYVDFNPREIFRHVATAKGLTGVARANQLRLWLSNTGHPLPAGRKILEQFWPECIAELQRKCPLNEHGLNTLRGVFFGHSTQNDSFKIIIESSLQSPALVMEWFAQDWQSLSPGTSWLRRSGETICKVINDGVTAAQGLRDQQILSGVEPDVVARMEIEVRSNSAESIATMLFNASRKKNQSTNPETGLPEHWRTLAPALETLASVASEILWRAIELSNRTRKPTRSDFGDMLHLLYLPYVDVFRADGAMADIIKHSGSPLGGRIVQRQDDLIEVIEGLLESPRNS